jgi:hypothetical protein
MGVALAALRSWIGHDLPVIRKRLASYKIADYRSEERDGQEDVEVTQHFLVGALPDAFSKGSKVHANTVLDHPEAVLS